MHFTQRRRRLASSNSVRPRQEDDDHHCTCFTGCLLLPASATYVRGFASGPMNSLQLDDAARTHGRLPYVFGSRDDRPAASTTSRLWPGRGSRSDGRPAGGCSLLSVLRAVKNIQYLTSISGRPLHT